MVNWASGNWFLTNPTLWKMKIWKKQFSSVRLIKIAHTRIFDCFLPILTLDHIYFKLIMKCTARMNVCTMSLVEFTIFVQNDYKILRWTYSEKRLLLQFVYLSYFNVLYNFLVTFYLYIHVKWGQNLKNWNNLKHTLKVAVSIHRCR